MIWLFAYGTLREAKVQTAVFGRPLKARPDALAKFQRHEIEIPEAKGRRRYPILRRGSGRVRGVALAVTPAELARADAYEGAAYRRIAVGLSSGRRAFVYVAGPQARAGMCRTHILLPSRSRK